MCTTPQKERNDFFWKIYDLRSFVPFQTCLNLRVISLPSTWSSSIIPSHPLSLKPILILFQPLLGIYILHIPPEVLYKLAL